jgi:hypothetical protein
MKKEGEFRVDVFDSLNLKPRVQEALYRILMYTPQVDTVWTTAGGKHDDNFLQVEFHDTQALYLAQKSVNGGGTDNSANGDDTGDDGDGKREQQDDFNFKKGALGTPIDQKEAKQMRPGTAGAIWVQAGCVNMPPQPKPDDWTISSAKEWCRAHPEVVGFTFYAADMGKFKNNPKRKIYDSHIFFKPRGSIFYTTEFLWTTGHSPSSKEEDDGYGTYVKDDWQSLLFMAGLKEGEVPLRKSAQIQRKESEAKMKQKGADHHLTDKEKGHILEQEAKQCAFEEKAETMHALFMQIIHKDIHFDQSHAKLQVRLSMLLPFYSRVAPFSPSIASQ